MWLSAVRAIYGLPLLKLAEPYLIFRTYPRTSSYISNGMCWDFMYACFHDSIESYISIDFVHHHYSESVEKAKKAVTGAELCICI
jgi:hypothetical protein